MSKAQEFLAKTTDEALSKDADVTAIMRAYSYADQKLLEGWVAKVKSKYPNASFVQDGNGMVNAVVGSFNVKKNTGNMVG